MKTDIEVQVDQFEDEEKARWEVLLLDTMRLLIKHHGHEMVRKSFNKAMEIPICHLTSEEVIAYIVDHNWLTSNKIHWLEAVRKLTGVNLKNANEWINDMGVFDK